MAGRTEAGQAFINELLARIPEDRRGAVAEAMNAAPDAINFLGDGALRQSEFSRKMEQVQKDHTALTAWYEENQALLERGRLATTSPVITPVTPTTPATPSFGQKDVEGILNQRELSYAQVTAQMTTLASRHLHEFGEVLDVSTLINDPKVGQLGLEGVYREKFAPRYAEKAAKVQSAAIETEVQKRLGEERAKSAQFPFPTGPRDPMDVSPLETLEAEQQKAESPRGPSVQEMADAYTAAVSKRYGIQ
jgi:hypothetical protein